MRLVISAYWLSLPNFKACPRYVYSLICSIVCPFASMLLTSCMFVITFVFYIFIFSTTLLEAVYGWPIMICSSSYVLALWTTLSANLRFSLFPLMFILMFAQSCSEYVLHSDIMSPYQTPLSVGIDFVWTSCSRSICIMAFSYIPVGYKLSVPRIYYVSNELSGICN